jgi:hypothetical protein
MKKILKEMVVTCIKYCSTIFSVGKRKIYCSHWKNIWRARKMFWVKKFCTNLSAIFIIPSTKSSRICRLMCVSSTISREFSLGTLISNLQTSWKGCNRAVFQIWGKTFISLIFKTMLLLHKSHYSSILQMKVC